MKTHQLSDVVNLSSEEKVARVVVLGRKGVGKTGEIFAISWHQKNAT